MSISSYPPRGNVSTNIHGVKQNTVTMKKAIACIELSTMESTAWARRDKMGNLRRTFILDVLL